MPRTSLLLPASLLLSCAPVGLDTGAAAPPAGAPCSPDLATRPRRPVTTAGR